MTARLTRNKSLWATGSRVGRATQPGRRRPQGDCQGCELAGGEAVGAAAHRGGTMPRYALFAPPAVRRIRRDQWGDARDLMSVIDHDERTQILGYIHTLEEAAREAGLDVVSDVNR